MNLKIKIILIIFPVLAILKVIHSQSFEELIEDGGLNFTSIAKKYGMDVEEYDIVTEDGYILKLFRLRGDIKRPVLLVHGILDSAYTYIIRGKRSLSYSLVQARYDVWLINLRGVTYSQRHVSLCPKDPKFWDYSFNELGYYDLPATVDFILKTTGQSKLSAIGHSQGNSIFYVLGATRPEYNDKVKVLIALAPVCYLSNLKPPVSDLIDSGPLINEILIASNVEGIFAEDSFYREILDSVCKLPIIGYSVCSRLLLALAGEDQSEFNPEIYYVLVGHFPTSTSRKNALHLLQVATSKEFANFDYGPDNNKIVYGTELAPKYNLHLSCSVSRFLLPPNGACK